MAEMNIGKTTVSDYTNSLTTDGAVYQVAATDTDGPTSQDETEYSFPNWTKQYGYFMECEELRNAILMKAVWNVGKGWTANSRTTAILETIQGWGKDTFDDILFNMEVIKRIGGDAFAEIIRDENDNIINLKPLNTGSMKIIINQQGQIVRYEQTNRIGNRKRPIKFKPEDIFHLSHNRIADQMHGLSDIDAVEEIIKADKEHFRNVKKVMLHQARPLILWKLKTDNEVKISEFVSKINKARNYGEDPFIPDDEDIVSHEVVNISVSELIITWANEVKNKFYRAIGLPQIVFGASGTESGSKIEYLAHQQIFEKDQRYLEKQIETQLGFKINLISPVSLLENLQTDEAKDNQNALTFQPNDVTAGVGRDNE